MAHIQAKGITNMGARILAIEDSIETFNLVRRALGTTYQVDMAKSAREASECLARNTYDLILMDVQLPD
ncbi:MAG: response regulator, partial [Bdellovibrionota bacterium]